MATQKLMTAELRKALPALYANENKPLDEALVIAKFFNPYGAGTFYITEFDGEDTMFGFVALGMGGDEWGYISLSELMSIKARIGGREMPFQGIERDTSWRPTKWADVKSRL